MKEMTTQDIVRNSDVVKENNLDWKRVYTAMHQTIEKNTHRVVRVDNTLFWVELLPNDEINFTVISSEPDEVIDKQFEQFRKAIATAGLRIAGA
jgi:hypothetical protein